MISNRIKVLRAERDWTQADLAERVGISRQAVISYGIRPGDSAVYFPFARDLAPSIFVF